MSDFESWRKRLEAMKASVAAPQVRPRPLAVSTQPVSKVPAKPRDATGQGFNPSPAPVVQSFSLPALTGASVTLSRKQMARDARKLGPKEPGPAQRPRTRGECCDGPRPCPHVGCRHHLAIDVTPKGSVLVNHPGTPVEEMTASCSLDVADAGPQTLEAVGQLLNVTRERARQLETQAIVSAEKAFKTGEVKQFRGSCKAVSAFSGRTCQLPAHSQNMKHHDGRHPFVELAAAGQTSFEERERAERVATANAGEALHERG